MSVITRLQCNCLQVESDDVAEQHDSGISDFNDSCSCRELVTQEVNTFVFRLPYDFVVILFCGVTAVCAG